MTVLPIVYRHACYNRILIPTEEEKEDDKKLVELSLESIPLIKTLKKQHCVCCPIQSGVIIQKSLYARLAGDL